MIARLAAPAFAALALAIGCSGSAPSGPDATVLCTQSIYDPCESEHDCSTTECEPTGPSFNVVCTIPCTAGSGSACPDQNGVAVECGSDGFCDPAMPNACTIAP